MEVKHWTYAAYPEYRPTVDDALVLDTTGDEVQVVYHHDVAYARVDGRTLSLQVLEGSTRNHPDAVHPVVLYVQGSHWDRQDVYKAVPSLSLLAARGYVAAIVQYRGYDVAPFPATLEDTRRAVLFVREHAARFHGDPKRIILAGNSSGGHAAVYTPVRFPDVARSISGIIDYYGSVSVMAEDSNPSTLDHCRATSPEGREMGGVDLRQRPDLRRELSVECHITPSTDLPPVLILHGTKDRTVNPSCSEVLYRTLKRCGKEARLVFLRGADHGGGEFWAPPVLDLVDRFIASLPARG